MGGVERKMEYIIVMILLAASIIIVGRHLNKVAKGESDCSGCDCSKSCSIKNDKNKKCDAAKIDSNQTQD